MNAAGAARPARAGNCSGPSVYHPVLVGLADRAAVLNAISVRFGGLPDMPPLHQSRARLVDLHFVCLGFSSSSCPAKRREAPPSRLMCRASTSCFHASNKDVDGREKPGHDEKQKKAGC